MATIECTYQGKTKTIYQNDAFIEEYSDDPDALGNIIRELTDLTCNLSVANDPWYGMRRLMSKVTIGYRGRNLQFDFYHSIRDTEEWGTEEYYQPKKARRFDSNFLKNVLYSLLCTIKSDAGIHELDFYEFCSGHGYDEDSRKAYAAYERCCDFSRKIARVFSNEEIESFPS